MTRLSMQAACKLLPVLLLLFAPAASYAVSVPLPVEGATLNVSLQLQTQFLVNEAGAPDGRSPSYDLFVRRSRVLINGDFDEHFSYLVQIDNPNFGKFGNFSGRAIVQDAWVGWAPTGIKGGTVVYVDAGILLMPISHHLLESTTNFVTADAQIDAFRFPGNVFPAFRDTGVQVRGWALDKKIGFRGGVYEGYGPVSQVAGACAAGGAGCITAKRNPALAGFVNFDILGSEEGAWLYGAYKWGRDPILSVGVAANYQSLALKNAFGSPTDQKLLAPDLYLNLPVSEQAELVSEVTLYLNGNGTGSANTGVGVSASLGYRFGFIAPYVAYDYFQSSACDAGSLSAAQLTTCNATVETADSRNFKAGVNVFFSKNLNHLNVELSDNHGQSAYGPSSITAATAGYVPASVDPLGATGPRRAFTNTLANPAFKSLLVHWNVLF
ncbi:MAG: hypothetical protein ACJ79H_01645 [Myxococcales bacterium]